MASNDFDVGTIDAQAHLDGLALLAEVASYMRRLPPHPITMAMVHKVETHLNDPGAQARQQRLLAQSEAQNWTAHAQSGTAMEAAYGLCPEGSPLISARLLHSTLSLHSPALEQYRLGFNDEGFEAAAEQIARYLEQGVTLKLGPPA